MWTRRDDHRVIVNRNHIDVIRSIAGFGIRCPRAYDRSAHRSTIAVDD
jgi:hypothetical protein